MLTCNDCIHSEVCVRQKIYGEYSITECKGHFLGKADVQEGKHGEWIVNAWNGNDWEIMPYIKEQHTDPFCSCCKEPAMRGVRSGTYETSNYCPNCGAKMDKRSEDNG